MESWTVLVSEAAVYRMLEAIPVRTTTSPSMTGYSPTEKDQRGSDPSEANTLVLANKQLTSGIKIEYTQHSNK